MAGESSKIRPAGERQIGARERPTIKKKAEDKAKELAEKADKKAQEVAQKVSDKLKGTTPQPQH